MQSLLYVSGEISLYEMANHLLIFGDTSFAGYELNQLRTSIRRTLQSVLYILEGNFPDTFEQERRVWGFLKDRY